MPTLHWTNLTPADLPRLRGLARACLAADGGLPQLDSDGLLTWFFLSGSGTGGEDDTGDLVAAAGVFLEEGLQRTATGLVHPSLRRQGIGAELVRWCREQAPGVLAARVENVTDLTEDLLTDAGMMRTFAELVMRQPLRSVPRVERPEGIAVLPFEPATVPLFHRAAQESFADRPGFEAVELEPWAAQLRDDEAFQPALSRVALTADDRPVGFVTLSRDWVDQVGVIPQWRGRGLGGHLVARSLSALAKAGSSEVWLAVNVDNPAQELYRRLGFEDYGLRARYRDVPVD